MARFGSQEWYQRIRASKSVEASRRGFILGGLMAAPFGILTMVMGIAALEQMPGLANPEEAFARSMMSAMPVGLRALMMSAILAAVVTSGESSVNAATALFVNDVCKRLVPDRSDRFYLRLSQVSCAVLGLVALVLALNAPHIVEYIRLGVHDSHAGGDHRADGPLLARRQRDRSGRRDHRRDGGGAGMAESWRSARGSTRSGLQRQ